MRPARAFWAAEFDGAVEADAVRVGVYADTVNVRRLQGRRDPRAEFELRKLRLGVLEIALRVLLGTVQGLLRAARQHQAPG